MPIRFLAILFLLSSCSLAGNDVTKTVEVSADTLAAIAAKPYTGGNGPGGFAAAALSVPGDESLPGGIEFTGFGPYLHEMGVTTNMVLTHIDCVGVAKIFADRWSALRLGDPSAYDAAHYRDLIQYIFLRDSVNQVLLTFHVKVSIALMNEGPQEPRTEVWQLNLRR